MKRNIFLCFLVIIAVFFITCVSTQPMSESTRLFMKETNLSTVIHMRFYTWVKIVCALPPNSGLGSVRLSHSASLYRSL
jgi:hypothetical protein